MLDQKHYGVAILMEGSLENLDNEDLQALENFERDDHRRIRLAKVNFLDILNRNLEQDLRQIGVHVRLIGHVLGYELRCAPPCVFDVEYTRTLGEAAVNYLLR